MFGQAGLRLIQKMYVMRTSANAFRINWLMHAVSLPFMLSIVVWKFHYIEGLTIPFWLTLFAVVVGFYPLVSYLFVKVLRNNDVSDVLPLMGFIPVFTTLFGWVLLGQKPSATSTTGIIIISLSIYIVQMQPSTKLIEPIKRLFDSATGRAMMAISLVTAIAAIGDKYAISHSSPLSYMALNLTGAFLLLALCDALLQTTNSFQNVIPVEPKPKKNTLWLLLLMGGVYLLTQLLSFSSLAISPNAGYAVAIRNLNIIVASIAAIILFKEKLNVYKSISYTLSALGLVLVAF